MNQDGIDPVFEKPTRSRKPSSTIAGSLGPDSEPSGFILNQDQTPKFVKATTRYEILDEIGRGGMGIVYRAQDWQLNRHVAIKILKPQFIDNPKLIRRFIDEARIMGTLQHPCIAHVYECGHCDDGRPFHGMKLVEGQTMYSMLHKRRPNRFNTSRLLDIFARICQAMAYTHSRGVVHLDLKPGNIMVGEFGEVHLMDWGLAKFQNEVHEQNSLLFMAEVVTSGHTEKSTKTHVQGTLEYMSPEQARGESLDQRTDVFCLGAILYEILTGETLYQGDNRIELHRQAALAIQNIAFQKLDRCGANHFMVRLTKHCLASNPNERPINATVLAAEMSAYLGSTLERVQNDMTRFFELSLDLFCIAGFDGYFRRINSNFSRVLGYTEAQLLTRPFLDYVHDDDREKTVNAMAVLIDGQPVVRFHNRYRASNGRYLEFEWTSKSIPEENVIFAVARNLSESSLEETKAD